MSGGLESTGTITALGDGFHNPGFYRLLLSVTKAGTTFPAGTQTHLENSPTLPEEIEAGYIAPGNAILESHIMEAGELQEFKQVIDEAKDKAGNLQRARFAKLNRDFLDMVLPVPPP